MILFHVKPTLMADGHYLAGSYAGRDVNVGGDYGTPLAREAEQHVDMLRRAEGTARFRRPAHTRTFVVANQKGGVGKTTSAVNIAAAMALRDRKSTLSELQSRGHLVCRLLL